MAGETTQPTYTEALMEVREGLAVIKSVLEERTTTIYQRLDGIGEAVKDVCAEHDLDHEEIGKLKTRAALIEQKQSRSTWILGGLQALTLAIASWFGARS